MDRLETINEEESENYEVFPLMPMNLGSYYVIQNAVSSMVLTEDNGKVNACKSNQSDSQKWRVVNVDDGLFRIINKKNSKALEVIPDEVIIEANIDKNKNSQLWLIQDGGNGTFTITSKSNEKPLHEDNEKLLLSKDNDGKVATWSFIKSDNVPFIIGTDPSYLQEEEPKGVKYYDESGNQQDPLEIYSQNGFKYARFRVWNDSTKYVPEAGDWDFGYDKLGYKVYDKEQTLKYAKRAYDAGMKLFIDFHYSDIWADGSRQVIPKDWDDYKTVEELEKAIYDYTKDVLQGLEDQGTSVDLVQIGNEINGGMLYPYGITSTTEGFDNCAKFLKAGIKAAKEVNPEVKIVIQSNRADLKEENEAFFENLIKRGVSIDILGLSYYTNWHGSLSMVYDTLNNLVTKFNKPVMIVENAQPWEYKEGDFYKPSPNYDATIDGQIKFFKDLLYVLYSIKDGMCIGIFEWGTDLLSGGTLNGNLFDWDGKLLKSAEVFKNASN